MNKKYWSIIAIAGVFAAAFSMSLSSTPVFRMENDASQVNWQKGFVSAKVRATIEVHREGYPVDSDTGFRVPINRARMDAYRLARQQATENLVLLIRRLRIDGDSTMNDIITSESYTQRGLSDSILHAVRVREYPGDFYSSRCEVNLRFADIIGSLPYDFPNQEFPQRDDAKISTYYTGLVIDGRGLDIVPMIFPSVYDENGLEIYGRIYVQSAAACRRGIASYCTSEQEAMRHEKAGTHPYYTVALRSLKGCPVLSDRDARRLLASKKTTNRLKNCNVIIIVNRERL